jgi:L-threonylcarbamoyladenylate synthase
MSSYNTIIGADIEKAAELLSQGELVAIPTETVYGLAGNAYSVAALSNIFRVKQRPRFNPFILHVPDIASVEKNVLGLNDLAIKLMEAFSPGPLTVILPKRDIIPHLATNDQPDVAIRIPAHPVALSLLRLLPFPLAAPSANKFMGLSPTAPQHVYRQLSGAIPYILDGGRCHAGVESTVVRPVDDEIIVYRLGAITLEQLRAVHPRVRLHDKTAVITSPGMLSHHYAPATPLIITGSIHDTLNELKGAKLAIISFGDIQLYGDDITYRNLSLQGNFEEASRNLYSTMYELDMLGLDYIITGFLPDTHLGKTINDRLRRAAKHIY